MTERIDLKAIGEGVTTNTAPAAGPLHPERGTILGTAAYMAPEQAEGNPATAQSDVFSFGAVLYEMITGRRAFGGATKISTLAAILTKEPEPPSHIIPGLPADLEKLIMRCLRKSPERRWQSMALHGPGDLRCRLVRRHDEGVDDVGDADPAKRVQELGRRGGAWVFARVTMGIDRVHTPAGQSRAQREPCRRSPLPGSDLHDRAMAERGGRGCEKRASLRIAEPAFGG